VGAKATVAAGCDEAAGPRPLRADAARNRARILEAAEVVFAAEGIEVPVDVIADKAGVGVGTLYRHFPTKERLCEAILLERLTDLTDEARGAANAEDPAGAFFGFLGHVVDEGCAKRDLLFAVMGAGVEFEIAAAPVKDELREAVGVLLARAQAVGAVRTDVTATTVVTMAGATCQAIAHSDDSLAPQLLSILRDGLRVAVAPAAVG
jgi:AcrR family transcriptional regulator